MSKNHREKSQSIIGLVDTGAMVNVLAYQIGFQLGAVWEEQTTMLQLSGNLAQFEARVLILSATVGQFPSVRLVFAQDAGYPNTSASATSKLFYGI